MSITRILRAAAAALMLCLAMATAGEALAQDAATPAPAVPSAEQLKGLVQTLQDESARNKLVEQLQSLIAAQQADAGDGETQPVTLGSRLLSIAAGQIDHAGRRVVEFARTVWTIPVALEWIVQQAEDPSARERWCAFAIEFLLIVAAGGVVATGVDRLLARPLRLIVERAPTSYGMKLPLALLRAMLELIPIAAFAAIAFAVLSISDLPRVRLASLAVINAAILVRLVVLVAGAFFDPAAGKLRLASLSEREAGDLMVWIRRFANTAVFGYFLVEAAFVLGLPLPAYGIAMQLLGLSLTVLLVRLILLHREEVAEWMRTTPLLGDGETGVEREGRDSLIGSELTAIRSARRRLADVWHIIIIAYIVAVFAVWTLNVYGGFEYLAKATGLTIFFVLIARLLVNGALRAMGKALNAAVKLAAHHPLLEVRARRYRPALARIVKTIVWGAAALLVLNAWGIDTPSIMASRLGQRVLGSALTIFVSLVLAILAWEAVSVLIEALLGDEESERREHSGRARTLLPLIRNAFLFVLVTVMALITLSELGVNIAPLLAGAGILGVAVGFGSQTLVKDVITGLFILFEDTIAVGDVVDVGSGHSGVVEAITIRTIRLRDVAGAVHSVPFSAVTTVKNMTKDFSFAVFDVQVAYAEDPDRVTDVLKELGRELHSDPAFRREILAPLEVMGLDRLADSGIVIKARFKTRPMQQWSVGREFNRRMFKRFAELGISIPYPHMQLVMTSPAAAADTKGADPMNAG